MCLKKVRDIKKGEGDDEKRKAGWEAETTFRTMGWNPITNYVREFSHFYLPCKLCSAFWENSPRDKLNKPNV